MSLARMYLPAVPVLCSSGNMSAAGLLQQAQQAVFMELGAGKAWLTAWLHMLTPGSNEFVLLDKVGCFHNKVGSTTCCFGLRNAPLTQPL